MSYLSGMRGLVLVAVLAAAPAAASSVDAERAQAADRLALSAQRMLDSVLGPGRAQVQVDVDGDSSELTTETELLIPQERPARTPKGAPRSAVLPGYAKDRPADASKESSAADGARVPYQKDHEKTTRESGFQIRSMRATVVLDSALGDGPVREATQLLPQILKMDSSRGDTLTLLRAPIRPAWKAAFSTPQDWRSAVFVLGGAAALVLAALIAGAGLARAGRLLGRELAARRSSEPALTAAAGEPLPELPYGGGILLASPPADAGHADAPALLGRRFDFLVGRDPLLIAAALAAEKTPDLALFFGHLSESIPDLASRLFSQLSGTAQSEISEALVKLVLAEPDRLSALEDRLRLNVENGVLGSRSLGRILSRVPGETRTDLLSRLAARDARAVEEVERHLFAFEDLAGLDAAALRRLAAVVPSSSWGPALRGAPAGLAERIVAELPPGDRERVLAAAAAPQSRERIAAERSRVLDALTADGTASAADFGGLI
jgi:hypothetical protein